MNVEAKTARMAIQDKPAFNPNCVGTKVEALINRSELALAGMEIMKISDWDALKLELHQKIQELKQSGDGLWQRVKPDLEAKVAVLEASIGLPTPGSGNIRREPGGQQRNNRSLF
jgi:hypothetical protein